VKSVHLVGFTTKKLHCYLLLIIFNFKSSKPNAVLKTVTSLEISFIVAPCILISSKSFIYQQMHFISVLENIKNLY